MLSITFAFLIAAVSPDKPASFWGKLEVGEYAVGFQQWQRYDRGRAYRHPRKLDGTPRAGELGRPMQIAVWYPAEGGRKGALLNPLSTRPIPMTMGDYLDMIPSEATFEPENADLRADVRAHAEAAFVRNTAPAGLSVEGLLRRLRQLAGRALKGAKPAKGRFPLIVYSLFSPAISPASAEYLASHGYVVVTMPRVAPLAGLPDTLVSASDLETKVRDMDFLIDALHDFPSADLRNTGVVGFSAGGWWGLSEVMRNPSVRAMVSLDTVMLFDNDAKKAWKTMPFFDLDAVRVPILHLVRKEWVPQEDQAMWEAMRYADRLSLQFQDPVLTHWDFQSVGYALLQAGARESAAASIEASFLLFNRYTLAFFDAHLRGDAKAQQWLARDPSENGAPPGFVIAAARKGEKAPRSPAEFLGALDEDGAAAVATAYRDEWRRLGAPPLSESLLNLAAYGLLLRGRRSDAIQMFELNVAAFPLSANVYDSLADACLEAGDTKRAKELAARTLAVLEADSGLTPIRKKLIREAAEEKLRRLR